MTLAGDTVPVDAAKVEAEFARAMSADVTGDVPAPPRRPESDPEAPKPRRGRPPKEDRARVSTAPSEPSRPVPAPRDYTKDLNGLAEGVWLTLGLFPVSAPYAAIVRLNQPGLVAAVNSAAQKSPAVRRWVDQAATGSGGVWAVQLGVVAAGMALQTWQVMRDPELRAALAAQTQQEIRDYLVANKLVPDDNHGKQG